MTIDEIITLLEKEPVLLQTEIDCIVAKLRAAEELVTAIRVCMLEAHTKDQVIDGIAIVLSDYERAGETK